MSVFRVILVHISPASSSIWTEDGEILHISPNSVQTRENSGKMRTRITPNVDTFYAVHPICNAYHENMAEKFCKLYKSQFFAIFFSMQFFSYYVSLTLSQTTHQHILYVLCRQQHFY